MKVSIKATIRGGVATSETVIKLGGPTFLSITMNDQRVDLDRVHAKELLEKLETFGENCSEGCKQARTILKDALKKEAA
jgi:hypothetical protein